MATELRVHGVSGTPAEAMLDRPLLHRVAGDADAGFSRPHPAYRVADGPGGTTLEGYRWGGLTAGAAARALWLLLLPFMLANVAMWLRPRSGTGAANAVRALCRVFALSVTATFVLSFVGVSVDLVGWQCAANARCVRGRWYLDWLSDGFFAPTGRRLAVTALVPIAAIFLLWYLGGRTWSRYEAYPVTPDGDGDGLGHPCFWSGKALVGRLRSIHVAVGFTTVDAVLLAVLVRHERRPAALVLAAATALILLACVLVVCLQGMVDRDAPGRWAEPFAGGLRTAAVLLTVLTLGYAALPRAGWPATGGLPGFGMSTTGLFAAQLALLLVLGSVVLFVRRPGAYLGGTAVPVLCSVSLGVAVAFSAGLSYRVADFLDRSAVPSPADFLRGRASRLEPPASYAWAALGFVATVFVVAVVVAYGRLVVLRRLRTAAVRTTDEHFPGQRPDDPERARTIDTAIADARLIDHSGQLVGWVYVPLALMAVVFTGLALAGARPVRLVAPGTRPAVLLSFAVNLGTYLIGLAALGLLLLGLLAYRYQRVRRVVGVLWDLGTFWPRAAHPLAPPCYSERVVPELVTRTSWLAGEQGGGGVILSGHSQGSVLVVATVLQLPAAARRRTAVVTYGSPLRRLYCRLFPAYLNDQVLARVGGHLAEPGKRSRWVNLWRETDPIGGPVGPPSRDIRLTDPSGFGIAPGDTVYPAVEGHSGYQAAPAFANVILELAATLPPARPAPPAPPPALPEQEAQPWVEPALPHPPAGEEATTARSQPEAP
jgi:hypothetical protein